VATPELVEDRVVDLEVRASATEDRRAGRVHLGSLAKVHERERAGEVERSGKVGHDTRGTQDPREDHRVAHEG
jgi:hypothetical protein